jgi:hypothetical protein
MTAIRDQISENVPVTRQLGKTIQRFVVSQVKSICLVISWVVWMAQGAGEACIHGAHGLRAHVAVVHVAVIHSRVVGVIHSMFGKCCLLMLW